jgi:hypothetical protein
VTDDLPEFREREALAPEEKEVIIKFSKDGDATLFSEIRGVSSRLFRHPEVEVERVVLADGTRVEDMDVLTETHTVTAVEATAPPGVLKIQRAPRGASATLADVVSERVLGGARQ